MDVKKKVEEGLRTMVRTKSTTQAHLALTDLLTFLMSKQYPKIAAPTICHRIRNASPTTENHITIPANPNTTHYSAL